MYSQVKQPDVIKLDLLGAIKKAKSNTVYPKLTEVVKDEIWVVDAILNSEECEILTRVAEKAGFDDALVTTGVGVGVMDKDYRDSKRVMIDDIGLAEYLTERCYEYLPRAYEGGMLDRMNERFRFLKYAKPGQKFAPHIDGCYCKNDLERTAVTVQFYLNEGMQGGATTFFDSMWKDDKFACVPKKGRCAFFRQQGWLHEGSELIKGVKYTIRNDVLYKWPTEKEKKDFKHEKCGKCGSMTRFEKLKSCGHLFLMCDCHPFNFALSDKRYHNHWRCPTCSVKVKFEPELDKKIREY